MSQLISLAAVLLGSYRGATGTSIATCVCMQIRHAAPRQSRSSTSLSFLVGALGFALLATPASASLVNLSAPTTEWSVIRYGGNPSSDPVTDQQTGSAEGDVVGNLLHPSVYTMFGDANTPSRTLAFRVRLGADASPAGFKTACFVGIITNRASGRIDLFVGVNNSGNNDSVGIWNPGTGLNTSPSTTTIVTPALMTYGITAATYNWSPVSLTNDPSVGTATDLDGGGNNDYFLGFAIPFSDIVAQLAARGITGIDDTSSFSYVIATSTQGNSLNQDLNGVGANYNGASTWGALGALGDPTSPIAAVPEVNPTLLVVLLLGGVIGYAHLKVRRKSQIA